VEQRAVQPKRPARPSTDTPQWYDGAVGEETPADIQDGAPVLVTFLTPTVVNLAERGIDPEAAADLRARLAAFAEEWDSPEMDLYADHDAARSALHAR
jgi:hypothetical protein